MNASRIIVYTLVLLFGLSACKKDKVTVTCDGSSPTYTSRIKSIINANCTSSGCHPGYSTYAGIEGIIANGQFEREVLTNQTMPENGNLSEDELTKIKCWVENGYPEN